MAALQYNNLWKDVQAEADWYTVDFNPRSGAMPYNFRDIYSTALNTATFLKAGNRLQAQIDTEGYVTFYWKPTKTDTSFTLNKQGGTTETFNSLEDFFNFGLGVGVWNWQFTYDGSVVSGSDYSGSCDAHMVQSGSTGQFGGGVYFESNRIYTGLSAGAYVDQKSDGKQHKAGVRFTNSTWPSVKFDFEVPLIWPTVVTNAESVVSIYLNKDEINIRPTKESANTLTVTTTNSIGANIDISLGLGLRYTVTAAQDSREFVFTREFEDYIADGLTGITLKATATISGNNIITINKGTIVNVDIDEYNVFADSTWKPTSNLLLHSRIDGIVPSSWNTYVQGYTKVSFNYSVYISQRTPYVNMSIYNSLTGETKEIRIECGQENGYGNRYVTGTYETDIDYVGLTYYTFTFKDNRDRSVSITDSESITAYEYYLPQITFFDGFRAVSEDGTIVEKTDSTRIAFRCNWNIASVNNKNITTVRKIECKADTTGNLVHTIAASAINNGQLTLYSNYSFATDLSYRLTLTITDSLQNTITQTIVVSSQEVFLDFREGGKGIGIGKVAEADEMQVGFPATFFGNVTFKGNVVMPEGSGGGDASSISIPASTNVAGATNVEDAINGINTHLLYRLIGGGGAYNGPNQSYSYLTLDTGGQDWLVLFGQINGISCNPSSGSSESYNFATSVSLPVSENSNAYTGKYTSAPIIILQPYCTVGSLSYPMILTRKDTKSFDVSWRVTASSIVFINYIAIGPASGFNKT